MKKMPYGERFNTITHLIGAALAICGASVLLTLAIIKGDMWRIVAFAIYGLITAGLYTISTIYHGLHHGRSKDIFRKLDYIAIYLKIAASFTAFSLIVLRTPLGWTTFAAIWILAAIGILQEIIWGNYTRKFSILIYCVMSALVLVVIKPLIMALNLSGFSWLLGGGILYLIGLYFFFNDERLKHGHGIWHLFVMGGSLCHYLCILIYLA
jgi:hemolysin III